jgi:hypothetical protein
MHSNELPWFFSFIPWVFSLVGVLVVLVPAETILRFDRRTGYWLYKNAPDEETGIKRAKWFYRIFGTFFAVFPWLVFSRF